MEYPTYTRKQNLTCKLTDKDISDMRALRAGGATYKRLATLFDVHTDTVRKWVNEEYRQSCLERSNRYHRLNPRTREKSTLAYRKFMVRKKEVRPEMRKWLYRAESKCPYRKTEAYKNKRREEALSYYYKNREKVLAKLRQKRKDNK